VAESETWKRPILVLGVDRSGTSLLSEVLFRWGAYAGELEHHPRADSGNPQGYWEYGPMEDFLQELSASVRTSAWDPEYKRLMKEQALDPEWRRRALELAARMRRPDKPWFWKEPEIVLSLPFWKEILRDPVCLITLRDPGDSAQSYEGFFLPRILQGKIRLTGYFFLRWQYFMVTIFEELKEYKSKLIVSYERLVTSPQDECERICRFLAAEYGPAAACDPARVEQMAESIRPGLWRNRGEVSFLEANNVSRAQKELFSYLTGRVNGDGDVSDFDPSLYPFPEFWREYFSNVSVLRWLFESL
jgi:hypothetical protein